ncbi:MAG: hypothetical protein L0K41_00385 [Yaniella sp.]|nr:hypothetical protein [Yaniella sp.]MDN5731820.1 hypothetical protein [Yaniella sp.]MDN5815636.1 hypothetical protein [Yaniella sp.]MDN5818136.1 hypothetical protein [Yaniella sp.]MDN5839142.1 hypothetical protein [Yaniella sp.]MDN5889933.1 hypothetical protein [Yaniella sp.]
MIVVAVTALTGFYLALASQAAMALTLPVLRIAVWALWKQTGPSKRILAVSLFVVAVAGSAVLFLESRNIWPDWLADSGSLSGARHTLWSDALSLWATAPLVGA